MVTVRWSNGGNLLLSADLQQISYVWNWCALLSDKFVLGAIYMTNSYFIVLQLGISNNDLCKLCAAIFRNNNLEQFSGSSAVLNRNIVGKWKTDRNNGSSRIVFWTDLILYFYSDCDPNRVGIILCRYLLLPRKIICSAGL